MAIVKSFSFPVGETRGDTFYIKHGTNNFTVIDCYLKDGDGASDRKDEIIEEIVRESKGRICRFISTHPDNDHILGINYLDDEWPISNFYAVENNRPADKSDDSLTRYQELLANNNYAIKKGISRKWLNESNADRGSSRINFYWPDLDNEKFQKALETVKNGGKANDICPIFTYSINNGASFMWMGDLESDMQKEYYEKNQGNIPSVDILFQPHHGRKSASVPEDLLNAINPKLIIIGNAPSEHIDYGDSQQTITQNTSGDIEFHCDGHWVHIYTKKDIDNAPTCLTKLRSRSNIVSNIGWSTVIEWYYIGSLSV